MAQATSTNKGKMGPDPEVIASLCVLWGVTTVGRMRAFLLEGVSILNALVSPEKESGRESKTGLWSS